MFLLPAFLSLLRLCLTTAERNGRSIRRNERLKIDTSTVYRDSFAHWECPFATKKHRNVHVAVTQLSMLSQYRLLEKCGTRFVSAAVSSIGLGFLFCNGIVRCCLGLCKKMLEVPTMAEHDGDLYCRQCYTRKFGIRGVGFGIGAGALGMDAGERFGNTQSQLFVSSFCFLLEFVRRSFVFLSEVDTIIHRCPMSPHLVKDPSLR